MDRAAEESSRVASGFIGAPFEPQFCARSSLVWRGYPDRSCQPAHERRRVKQFGRTGRGLPNPATAHRAQRMEGAFTANRSRGFALFADPQQKRRAMPTKLESSWAIPGRRAAGPGLLASARPLARTHHRPIAGRNRFRGGGQKFLDCLW